MKNLPQFACPLSNMLALNWLTHRSKVKGGFQIFRHEAQECYTSKTNFSFLLKLHFLLLLSLSLLFFLKSLNSKVCLSFHLFHFFLTVEMWFFFFFFFWILFHLSAHLANTLVHSAQNALCIKICTHKWVCVCTYEYTYMLRKINGQIFIYFYFLIHVAM